MELLLPALYAFDYEALWIELVIPILKMKFQFQPEDVIFFRSNLLEHYACHLLEIGLH